MSNKGYQQYKEQSVMTMTSGELLLLLYDELLKRLKRAELTLEVKEYEVFDQSLDRAVEIICHLKDTLDFNYEISLQLSRLYDYFLYEISRVKASRKERNLIEVQRLIKEIRSAYAEAEQLV